MHLHALFLSALLLLTTTTAFSIPQLSANIARLTTSAERLTGTIQKRATYDVICRSGIFQNPDEDIAAVICQVDAKCQGGTESERTMDGNGVVYFQAQCFGCPSLEEGTLTGGCAFESMFMPEGAR